MTDAPTATTNLLGEAVQDKVAKVVLFGDEIKPCPDSHWAYLGIVSVPLGKLKEGLTGLQSDRDEVGYQHEIGWSDIKKPGKNSKPTEKERLIVKWLTRVVNEHDVWRFSVIGIDTSKMVMSRFGDKPGEQFTNAYRRFFRANLAHHVSTLHRGQDGVQVVKSYHDEEGNLEADPYFRWYPHKVVGAKATVVVPDEIQFVNSCHNKEPKHKQACHFVQLCDVILGATRYVFEDYFPNEARDRAVKPLVPLFDRLSSGKSGNVQSSYKHVGRIHLSFFPSKALEEHQLDDDFARAQSSFFQRRPMMQVIRTSGQMALVSVDES